MLGNAKANGIPHRFWSTGKGFVDLHRGRMILQGRHLDGTRGTLLVLPQMQASHLGQDFQKQLTEEEGE